MQVLLHKPKKRMKRAEGQTGLDAEMLDDLCQSSSDLLKSKGVETLMLRDFTFSHHLTRKDIRSENLVPRLTAMAKEVTDALSLPQLKEVTVTVIPRDNTEVRYFGTYESSYRRINFFIKPDCFPEQLEAALCHECTHYFMDTLSMDDWSDRQRNEYRTDVMSCLVGFSRIMIRGYTVMTHARYRVVTWETDGMRVGYLDAVDCEHVRSFLLKARPIIQQKHRLQESIQKMKTDLVRNTAGARAMLEQLNAMKSSYGQPNAGRIRQKDMTSLQKAMYSLESGELEARLRQCETMSHQGDDQLKKALESVDALCQDLSLLHAAYKQI